MANMYLDIENALILSNAERIKEDKPIIKNMKSLALAMNNSEVYGVKEKSDFMKIYRYSTTGFKFEKDFVNDIIKFLDVDKDFIIKSIAE